MKKFSVLFLAGLLVLAFGAAASAQAPKLEFRASGFIDAQTFWGENVPSYQAGSALYGQANPNFATTGGSGQGSAGFNKVDAHWESRAHLKFDAIMGPNLSGTIYFEIDSKRWGNTNSSNFIGGPGNGREEGTFGVWNTDRLAVEVKNIYIDFGLPYFGIPVPITMRVGAQPIGVRPAMLVYSDGMGVTAGIKIDPVLISPIYAKMHEGIDFAADDADVWGLNVNAKIGTFTVGGYGLYYQMNTYPLFVTQTINSTIGGGFPAALNPTFPGTDKAKFWWFGAYADGKAGPLNLNFDFVYDHGSVDQANGNVGARHTTFGGWATRLKADYPWEKFNFGVVGMFATGGDTHSSSASNLPGTTTNIGTQSRYFGGYVVPPGSEQGPGNAESMVVYSMEAAAVGGYGLANRSNYATVSPGGFGGTWFAKLYGSMKATPWWKITFQGLYIGDTTAHGNTLGNARKFEGVTPAGYPTNALRNDTSIGWEFDLLNEFQIYNNLRFFAGFGYLFAGDATDVGKHVNGVNVNRSIANPWAFRTRLQYTF